MSWGGGEDCDANGWPGFIVISSQLYSDKIERMQRGEGEEEHDDNHRKNILVLCFSELYVDPLILHVPRTTNTHSHN